MNTEHKIPAPKITYARKSTLKRSSLSYGWLKVAVPMAAAGIVAVVLFNVFNTNEVDSKQFENRVLSVSTVRTGQDSVVTIESIKEISSQPTIAESRILVSNSPERTVAVKQNLTKIHKEQTPSSSVDSATEPENRLIDQTIQSEFLLTESNSDQDFIRYGAVKPAEIKEFTVERLQISSNLRLKIDIGKNSDLGYYWNEYITLGNINLSPDWQESIRIPIPTIITDLIDSYKIGKEELPRLLGSIKERVNSYKLNK